MQTDTMTMEFNVFLSWSGSRSGAAAEAFQKWLPLVLQTAKPWKSDLNIAKGSRSLNELSAALQGKVGIVFLTRENLDSRWIHYESGALSKTIDEQTRLCTYLLDGLKPSDIEAPLGMFQHTLADKEDTRKLVQTINLAINPEPRPEEQVRTLFDLTWPQLEKQLQNLPTPKGIEPPKRAVEDMVGEILDIVRTQSNRPPTFEGGLQLTTREQDALLKFLKSTLDMKTEQRRTEETLLKNIRTMAAPKPFRLKFTVKLKDRKEPLTILGTHAFPLGVDGLVIHDEDLIAAQFESGVESWWKGTERGAWDDKYPD